MTSLKTFQLLSEEEFYNAQEEFGEDNFRAGIGAEALKDILSKINLEDELKKTEEAIKNHA
jgi:DNA-directed RNA polymerase subunit beta'